jgi:hypothetical protein
VGTSAQSALAISLASALLAGCGGSQLPIGANGASAAAQPRSHHRIFHYTGGEQSFKVPAGVAHVRIAATGAEGATGDYNVLGGEGGLGGSVQGTIPVTPGERLTIFVGGSGNQDGFNGGGGPTRCPNSYYCFGGGGGASDVWQGATDWPTALWWGAGGGGGDIGGSGALGNGGFAGSGGAGGTQSSGGKGGAGGGSDCGGFRG